MKNDTAPDLTAYAGQWVALISGLVAGVGNTADEAFRLSQRNRPKERAHLQFVESLDGDILPLPALLDRIRPLLNQHYLPVYLVGGAVRDALLGRVSQDLDFVVSQHAVKLAFKIADSLNLPAYVLDDKRDTGRVIWPDENITLDFACFRGPDLEADLRARDFTINAIALPATASRTSSLIDPCAGKSDLLSRQLRQTHQEAILDDPVRSLRALRLASTLNFTLTEDTAIAMTSANALMNQVSSERIRDELLKLLQTEDAAVAISQMVQFGLLAVTLPEVADLHDVTQSPPHYEPVLDHTISVLSWLIEIENVVLPDAPKAEFPLDTVQETLSVYFSQLSGHLRRAFDGGQDGRLLLRLATLFHDAGKKETQMMSEDGRIRFYGHDKVGAKLVARRLRHLCFSNNAIDHVKSIVGGHMRPLLLVNSLLETSKPQPLLSRRTIYLYFRDTKTAGLDICLLSLADHLATYNGPGDLDHWQRLLKLVAELFHHYYDQHTETVTPTPLLNGWDLMETLHLKPGPEIGRLLRMIIEAQAAGEISTKDEAIKFAQRNKVS